MKHFVRWEGEDVRIEPLAKTCSYKLQLNRQFCAATWRMQAKSWADLPLSDAALCRITLVPVIRNFVWLTYSVSGKCGPTIKAVMLAGNSKGLYNLTHGQKTGMCSYNFCLVTFALFHTGCGNKNIPVNKCNFCRYSLIFFNNLFKYYFIICQITLVFVVFLLALWTN